MLVKEDSTTNLYPLTFSLCSFLLTLYVSSLHTFFVPSSQREIRKEVFRRYETYYRQLRLLGLRQAHVSRGASSGVGRVLALALEKDYLRGALLN